VAPRDSDSDEHHRRIAPAGRSPARRFHRFLLNCAIDDPLDEITRGATMKTTRSSSVAYPCRRRRVRSDNVQIYVLSNRADLISGGEALVEVTIPAGAVPAAMRVAVGQRDVTSAFAVRADGRYLGLIEGSRWARTSSPRSSLAAAPRTSPLPPSSGGPVFSGPQVQPCRAILERPMRSVLGRRVTSTFMFRRALTRRRRRDSSVGLAARIRILCLTTRPVLHPLR